MLALTQRKVKSRISDRKVQLFQLRRGDFGRRVGHQVGSLRGLGERDHIADTRLVGQDRDESIDARSDPAVGRRAVFKCLQHMTKLLLDLVPAQAEQLKTFN